jgi:hypothetical protein
MDSRAIAKRECNRLKDDWNPDQMEKTIQSLITYLKDYDSECGTKTWVKNQDRITAVFKGRRFADCAPYVGTLQFGIKLYSNSFLPNSYGYEKEKDYINARCNTKFERLLWLVMHEYCHLFKHQQKHCIAFYKFIDHKYLQFFTIF